MRVEWSVIDNGEGWEFRDEICLNVLLKYENA